MALTKVQTIGIETGITFTGITTTSSLQATTINVSGIATFGGNVSIAGTLTYEDVTDVDSVGLITARSGVNITGGGLVVTGVTTVSAGSTSIPSISPSGDTNTGIFFPSPDTIAFGEGGSEVARFDSSGRFAIGTTSPSQPLHVASTGTVARFESSSSDVLLRLSNSSNGLGYIGYQSSNLTFYVNDTERFRCDSSGRLLVGTSSSRNTALGQGVFQIEGGTPLATITANAANQYGAAYIFSKTRGSSFETVVSGDNLGILSWQGSNGSALLEGARIEGVVDGTVSGGGAGDLPSRLVFSTTADGASSPTERMRIDSSGRVGIGTTAPGALLHAAGKIRFGSNASYYGEIDHDAASTGSNIYNHSDNGGHIFQNGGTERLRIDSSGRLLVGTSSWSNSFTTAVLQGNASDGATGPGVLAISRGLAPSSLGAGNAVGNIVFTANNAGAFASIICEGDANAGTNDYPGRLVFSTTADGASSPTEALRINNDGSIVGGGNTNSANLFSGPGFSLRKGSGSNFEGLSLSKTSTSWGTALYIHRSFSAGDGTLIEFAHDTATEGTISISGTTVQLNGAHLSRWSQLLDGGREDILRGTVLSNLDEMCEWGDEDNEQLNRTKVSDVEGDPNVAGVFVDWDNDDDTYTEDFYCAMTGDFIIRIAEGVTVQRGDLLMSAGDGTAKPQDDDIIRSKTIAKVTSNHVTCTYDDGSYCVPCVLMAC
jgi:hypothetical protein